jgi:hypothetical protein
MLVLGPGENTAVEKSMDAAEKGFKVHEAVYET